METFAQYDSSLLYLEISLPLLKWLRACEVSHVAFHPLTKLKCVLDGWWVKVTVFLSQILELNSKMMSLMMIFDDGQGTILS